VLKPGGVLVMAIEPNRSWIQLLQRLKPVYQKWVGSSQHSAADEEAEGFTWNELPQLGAESGLGLVHREPVWLLAGFLHYGLEALFRILLRLKLRKKRMIAPVWVEKGIVFADKLLFRLPGSKAWAWHYTGLFQK